MAYNEKYIASSVFVNAPTGTDLSFGNGISFDTLVNDAISVKSKVVNISSAEILSMNSTPIVIVPAIENAFIEPLSFFWKIDFNTVAYDVTGISLIDLVYDPSSAAVVFFETADTACLSSTTTASYVFPRFANTDAVKLSANKPLVLTADADPTLGNSSVTVEVLYKITTFA
jgi:hypothetical protein